jgi:hypothetical protein
MKVNQSVLCSKGFEFVWSGDEWISSVLLQILSDLLSEASVGVQTSSHGSASLGDFVNILQGLDDTLFCLLKLMHVCSEFLTKGEWSGILSVGSTDLDNVRELFGLGFEGLGQSLEFRKETLVDFEDSCDVHD